MKSTVRRNTTIPPVNTRRPKTSEGYTIPSRRSTNRLTSRNNSPPPLKLQSISKRKLSLSSRRPGIKSPPSYRTTSKLSKTPKASFKKISTTSRYSPYFDHDGQAFNFGASSSPSSSLSSSSSIATGRKGGGGTGRRTSRTMVMSSSEDCSRSQEKKTRGTLSGEGSSSSCSSPSSLTGAISSFFKVKEVPRTVEGLRKRVVSFKRKRRGELETIELMQTELGKIFHTAKREFKINSKIATKFSKLDKQQVEQILRIQKSRVSVLIQRLSQLKIDLEAARIERNSVEYSLEYRCYQETTARILHLGRKMKAVGNLIAADNSMNNNCSNNNISSFVAKDRDSRRSSPTRSGNIDNNNNNNEEYSERPTSSSSSSHYGIPALPKFQNGSADGGSSPPNFDGGGGAAAATTAQAAKFKALVNCVAKAEEEHDLLQAQLDAISDWVYLNKKYPNNSSSSSSESSSSTRSSTTVKTNKSDEESIGGGTTTESHSDDNNGDNSNEIKMKKKKKIRSSSRSNSSAAVDKEEEGEENENNNNNNNNTGTAITRPLVATTREQLHIEQTCKELTRDLDDLNLQLEALKRLRSRNDEYVRKRNNAMTAQNRNIQAKHEVELEEVQAKIDFEKDSMAESARRLQHSKLRVLRLEESVKSIKGGGVVKTGDGELLMITTSQEDEIAEIKQDPSAATSTKKIIKNGDDDYDDDDDEGEEERRRGGDDATEIQTLTAIVAKCKEDIEYESTRLCEIGGQETFSSASDLEILSVEELKQHVLSLLSQYGADYYNYNNNPEGQGEENTVNNSSFTTSGGYYSEMRAAFEARRNQLKKEEQEDGNDYSDDYEEDGDDDDNNGIEGGGTKARVNRNSCSKEPTSSLNTTSTSTTAAASNDSTVVAPSSPVISARMIMCIVKIQIRFKKKLQQARERIKAIVLRTKAEQEADLKARLKRGKMKANVIANLAGWKAHGSLVDADADAGESSGDNNSYDDDDFSGTEAEAIISNDKKTGDSIRVKAAGTPTKAVPKEIQQQQQQQQEKAKVAVVAKSASSATFAAAGSLEAGGDSDDYSSDD
eukprot:jgi/Bigna1/90771/estExt_fgenesh1_pg.C_790010